MPYAELEWYALAHQTETHGTTLGLHLRQHPEILVDQQIVTRVRGTEIPGEIGPVDRPGVKTLADVTTELDLTTMAAETTGGRIKDGLVMTGGRFLPGFGTSAVGV